MSRALWVLCGLVFLLAVPSLAHGSAAPSNNTPAQTFVQFQTVATQQRFVQGTFWENFSQTQFGQSTLSKFPVAMPGSVPVSTILGSSFYLTASVQTGLTPRLNVTQGTATLANVTTFYSNTFYPAYTQTPVVVQVPTLYTPLGGYPNQNRYALFFNGTTTVRFETDTAAIWTGGGLSWKLSYLETAPSGWQFNQTNIYAPFPSTAINYSTVRVTINRSALPTYAVSTSGVSAQLPGLAAGSSRWINFTFASAATTTGNGPILIAPHYSAYGVNTNLYTFNVTWVNPYSVPYSGVLSVAAGYSWNIDPSRVTVTVNNSSGLLPGSYTVNGKYIQIQPGVLDVAPGGSVQVRAVVGFANAPSSILVTGKQIVWTGYGYQLPVNFFAFAFLIGLMLFLAIGWAGSSWIRKNRDLNIAVMVIWLVAFGFTVVINLGTI